MAVPNLWRTKEERYRLQGNTCPACANMVFPPKRVCPHCQFGSVAAMATDKHAAPSESDSYVLLFEMPQPAALSMAGDD